ncbi:MAG: 23S rRNA (uracil(1939)-C(5))-methyltransferase RlmD [Ruminococcaceae bacterium]|nr:23S rRNA (uracil(1939)-C(5))-methyltransferase RlmD [Oscillospiraceae bacterium]
MELRKNDIINLNITAMSSEGVGIGRTEDGLAVFVPMTAVGDELSVRILKVKKTLAYGKVEEVITPSSHRITSQCSVSRLCGGCVYNHISYDAELDYKEKRVADAISRIGGIDTKINPIVGAEKPCRYRNKAQIPVGINADGKVTMGFFSRHSHRIVDSMDCLLQPELFLTASKIFRDFLEEKNVSVYNEESHTGLVRHLYLRYGEATDELMICIVINGDKLPFENELADRFTKEIPSVKTIIVNSNKEKTNVITGKKFRTIYGDGFITDELCSLKFLISPQSFYQVNRTQAQRLYGIAQDYACLEGDETLIDLYCGTGTIGLSMARNCKELVGVEIVSKAIEDAKINAKNNGITNARFICGDAKDAAAQLENEGVKPDVVILDPPRKGCDSELIGTVISMRPKRIVYVSCDPATLARDLKLFSELGYKTLEVTPVDMFPHTAHVESVAKLFHYKGDLL